MKTGKLLIVAGLATFMVFTVRSSEKELADILHGLAGEQQKEGRGVDPDIGQIGAWERIGDIIQEYSQTVTWQPFEGESKVIDKDIYHILRMSPDRRYLAAGLYKGDKIHLWDLNQGYEKAKTIDGNINTIIFSHDNRYAATQLRGSNKIYVWNLQDMQTPSEEVIVDNFEGNFEDEARDQVIFSPDDRYLIHSFNILRLFPTPLKIPQFTVWDLRNLAKKPEVFTFFGYSPKGHYKIVRGQKPDDRIQIFDLQNPKNKSIELEANINAVYFSPDERMFIALDNRHIELWDIQNLSKGPKLFDSELWQWQFSPTGHYVVRKERDWPEGTKLWKTQDLYADKKPLETNFYSATFSPDDNYIFLQVSGLGKKNKLLDMTNKAMNFNIDEEREQPKFSPDNKYFISGIDTGHRLDIYNKIGLFSIKNLDKKLAIFNGSIENTYFSPDSRYIVTRNNNGIVITDLTKVLQKLEPKKEPGEPQAPKPPVDPALAAISDADLIQNLASLAEKLNDLEARLAE